ncbi:hypothetical protein Gotri_025218 [Gossypium trilobum]|uniref:Leucine-rich repeat-containing N-terminal plant-type domain-containing protein n=1 Tax=Gossypium trilobum TaxID=34281 RepID=A0A7J9FPD3_9ROSI|nr:hypothetical protein [Gossypium trilobum]
MEFPNQAIPTPCTAHNLFPDMEKMRKKGGKSNPVLFMLALSLLLPPFSLSQGDHELGLLLSFKSSVNDPLGFLSNWNSSVPFCMWQGITCNSFSHVKAIELAHKNITGTISSSIFHLPSIEIINLSINWLSGEIPNDMASSPSLRYLNLSNNNFIGPIPNCSVSLESLDLSNNMISGEISAEIGLCWSLKTLDLGGNYLVGKIPTSISNISSLQFLTLASNDLSGQIPSEIGRLKSLNWIYIGRNHFSGKIPEEIGNLVSLNHLDLAWNNLSGQIPSSLGNLSDLHYLYLWGNKLTGWLPTPLFRLKMLTELDLGGNHLSGEIPQLIIELQNLKLLQLMLNSFTDYLGTQSDLTILDLSMNNLSGKIPDELCHSGHLVILGLFSNSLQGQIPRSLNTCKSLEDIHLRQNRLGNDEGIVELDMFSNLPNLRFLDLSYNGVSVSSSINSSYTWPNLQYLSLASCSLKEFPRFLKGSKHLMSLDLSDNKIHGQIPKWMLNKGLDTLSYLNLSHNFLTHIERLPWENMKTLDLHSNFIQGALPVPPLTVSFFSISNNSLVGELSSLICNRTSLEILDLSYNNLNGTIPPCLGNFSKRLSVLDLRMNRFQGTIPDTFDKKCGLNNINFNGNELEGSIPPSLVHCRNMQVLDLGNNKIKDTFPRWLETLPEMQVLVLRSNKLHSFLPSPMVNHSFPELRILDLANNDLAGPLPKGYVENMKGMWNLDDQGTSSYMGTRNFSYHYSVSLTIKGFEIKLEKILTIFTSIDLSNNMFVGEISSFVGQHNSLRGLNLSHNSFSGQIPESIGNLTQLEWLDLSSNKLNGQIPHKLADLTFLAFLNLSDNRLTGPIPQGRQFNTFENASYHGNIGLCGFPLSRGCNADGGQAPPPSSIFKEAHDELQTVTSFVLKGALIGYGCGLPVGVVIGYVAVKTGRAKWLLKLAQGKCH